MSKSPLAMMAATLIVAMTPALAHAEDMMMQKDGMAMEKQMDHGDMMMKQQMVFSAEAFSAAEKSGEAFLVAFHKKGCSVCAKQQQALNAIYADPANAGLKVLVVDYDHDTESLKKFNVGQQSVLITYKGDHEITRTAGVTDKDEILGQLAHKGKMTR